MNRFLIVISILALLPGLSFANDINLSRIAGPSKGLTGVCKTETSPDTGPCRENGFNVYEKENDNFKKDQKSREKLFKNMVKELGLSILPAPPHEGRTTGFNGFMLNMDFSFIDISQDEDYWQKIVEGDNPSSSLTVFDVTMRKGLPYSFEVSVGFNKILDSSLYGLHGQLTFALTEGFIHFPDIALSAKVANLAGLDNLNLISGGADFIISKRFYIQKLVRMVPSLGYSTYMIHATTGQILPAIPGAHPIFKAEVFEKPIDEEMLKHRIFLGLYGGYLRGGIRFNWSHTFGGISTYHTGLVFRY